MNAVCCALSARPAARLNSTYQRRWLWVHQWKSFQRWQDLDRDAKVYADEQHRVKNTVKFGDLYLTPERVEQIRPKKALEDQTRRETGAMPVDFMAAHTMWRYLDHSFDNVRRVREYRRFQTMQYDQRFLPERLLYLGANLAAAHFLVWRGGAVKFIGDETWYSQRNRNYLALPGRKTPGFYIEGIDATEMELMFEGFDNLYDLDFCRMLSLANGKWTDDWTLSRLGGVFGESLEMLDLSNCKKISAKGLASLKSLKKLRFLRLDGLQNVPDIAKSALLLEEAIPGLTVVGLDFEEALDTLSEELKLLEDDRVLIDAKGNAFVTDDNGRLFYVKGCVNERPAVCDDDKPLVTSSIKRELPAMDDVEFERLDQLSKGKMRHLLLGSPSGYSWTEQVETILSFEQRWKEWEGKYVDPKMLPSYLRPSLPRDEKELIDNGEGGTKPAQLGVEKQSTASHIEGKEKLVTPSH